MMYKVDYYKPSVLTEIKGWPSDVLADYARLVELLRDHGPKLRMPQSRALRGGLFELRAHGREGAGRAFYCFADGGRVVMLHAFMKKTRRTPARHLAIARARMTRGAT
jgi:phage-related protein